MRLRLLAAAALGCGLWSGALFADPPITITMTELLGHTLKPVAFSALAAAAPCVPSTGGAYALVTDSATTEYGDTITGGGTGHVLAYCNGAYWMAAGK